MARTESTMLDLGTKAPSFALPDVVSGETISLDSFAAKTALLVIFLCEHRRFSGRVGPYRRCTSQRLGTSARPCPLGFSRRGYAPSSQSFPSCSNARTPQIR